MGLYTLWQKLKQQLNSFFTAAYQVLYGVFVGNKCLSDGCDCTNYCDDLTFNELTRQSHDALYAIRMLDTGVVGTKLKCDLCHCPREAHEFLGPRKIEPQYMPAGGLVFMEQVKREKRANLNKRFGVKDKMAEQVKTNDEVVGDGNEACLDTNVLCNYEATFASDGVQFEKKDELKFKIGANKVIPGLDQGIRGMKVGGTRVITIPPHYAYGDKADVEGRKGETLKFKINLLAAVR